MTMEIPEIIKIIESKKSGSHSCLVDLHIHTPASYDYQNKAITAQDIVKKAQEKGLGIIAITDHNCIEWCDRVREAAKETELVVLPGIEISTRGGKEGLHLVAVFPENTPVDVIHDKVLTPIGLSKSDIREKGVEALSRGKDQSSKNFSEIEVLEAGYQSITSHEDLSKIMALVRQIGGFNILHGDKEKGIVKDAKGEQRVDWLKDVNVSAIEINDIAKTQILAGVDPNYQRSFPRIFGSDAHNVEEIGSRATIINMGEASFEGLRQAFIDHESRILLTPQNKRCAIIEGMYFEGGYLNGEAIMFHQDLNCLIGGKGTGKSTVLELLRFSLGLDAKAEKTRNDSRDLVKATLSQGCVSVLIKIWDEYGLSQRFLIQRKLDSEPEVYLENGTEISKDISDFFEAKVLGQGELVEIARNIQSQLDLIDEFIEIEELKDKEKGIIQRLDANSKVIFELSEAKDLLEDRRGDLLLVADKLSKLDNSGIAQILEEQQLWNNEKVAFENLNTVLQNYHDRLSQVHACPETNLQIPKLDLQEYGEKNLLSNAINQLEELKEKVTQLQAKERSLVSDSSKEVVNIFSTWQNKYSGKSEEFLKKQQELIDQGVSADDIQRYQQLRIEKARLELQINELTSKVEQYNKAVGDRVLLLKELQEVRREKHLKRSEFAQRVDDQLEGFIKLEVELDGNRSAYLNFLMQYRTGSRIDEQYLKNLAEKVHPFTLSRFLSEDGSSYQELARLAEIPESTAQRITSHYKQYQYGIETVIMEDQPNIKLRIKQGTSNYRSLRNLSVGQKCTAVLSLLLLDSNTPLVIDQPEDNLDNSFIVDAVVNRIYCAKRSRQLILATHNANFPVIGDAELVLVMSSDGNNGFTARNEDGTENGRGNIDRQSIKMHIENLLEGGQRALERRMHKYGSRYAN